MEGDLHLDKAWLSTVLNTTVVDVKILHPTRVLEQSDVTALEVYTTQDGSIAPLPLLLKYVSVKKLQARMHKTEEKWRISVQSFENEWAFHGVVNQGQAHTKVCPWQ